MTPWVCEPLVTAPRPGRPCCHSRHTATAGTWAASGRTASHWRRSLRRYHITTFQQLATFLLVNFTQVGGLRVALRPGVDMKFEILFTLTFDPIGAGWPVELSPGLREIPQWPEKAWCFHNYKLRIKKGTILNRCFNMESGSIFAKFRWRSNLTSQRSNLSYYNRKLLVLSGLHIWNYFACKYHPSRE